MEIVIIAAVAEDGTIGDDGEMPWHHPDDLERFKRTTMGSPVIMGRRTYQAIIDRLGSALPGRTNIVLSEQDPDAVVEDDHQPDPETDIYVVDSIQDALDVAEEDADDTAYVIGGQTIYEQFFDRADRLVITEVPGEYDGDRHFPPIDPVDWAESEREDHEELSFVEYTRRGDPSE